MANFRIPHIRIPVAIGNTLQMNEEWYRAIAKLFANAATLPEIEAMLNPTLDAGSDLQKQMEDLQLEIEALKASANTDAQAACCDDLANQISYLRTLADGPATLNNTGVTAGTYGDATNVGQFTVGTDGRLTFAQNVAITFPAAPASTPPQLFYAHF